MAGTKHFWIVIFLVLSICYCTSGAKILLAMSSILNSPSQHIVLSAMTEPLVAKGHQVVLLAPQNKITKGLSPEAVSDKIFFASNRSKEELQDIIGSMSAVVHKVSETSSFLGMYRIFQEKLHLLTEGCVSLFKDRTTLDLLKQEQFDLIITLPLVGCDVLLGQYLNVPYVVVSPVRRSFVITEDHFRIPIPNSYVPFSLFTPFTDQMSFMERVKNILFRYVLHPTMEYITTSKLQAVKRELNIRPDRTLRQLTAEAELWFSYTNFALDFPQPTAPNWIPIGGVTAKPSKELPQVSAL